MYSPGSFFAFGKQGKLQRDVARPSAHPGLGVQREFCFLVEDCEKFSWWSRPGDFRLNRLGIWRDSLSQGGFLGEISPTRYPGSIPRYKNASPHQNQCRCFSQKPRDVQRGRATSTLRFWFLPKKKRGYKEMSNISLTPP